MNLSPDSGKFCLVFTLSRPWDNYHREQFIKNIADKIKEFDGYILCIEPTILSFFNLMQYPERFKKWIKGKYKFRKVYDNIYAVPANTIEHILLSVRSKPLKSANKKLLRRQVLTAIKKIDKRINRFVLVLHRPELHFLIGMGEIAAVYDCCDDYCLTSNMNLVKVAGNIKRERMLSEKCSFIITTAEKLYKRNKEHNQNTFLVENGYNYKNSAFVENKTENVIKNLKQPVIGYMGSVRNWVDFDLLEYLFKSREDWSFAFIGDIDKESEKKFNALMKKYSNLYVTGRISYDDYPSILRHVKVGIIPFKKNEFMESVNPNKFYEMIGLSIPVVSSNIGDISAKYSDISKVGNTNEEFLGRIEEILSLSLQELNELKNKIFETAKLHTWDKKAEFFVKLLEKYV